MIHKSIKCNAVLVAEQQVKPSRLISDRAPCYPTVVQQGTQFYKKIFVSTCKYCLQNQPWLLSVRKLQLLEVDAPVAIKVTSYKIALQSGRYCWHPQSFALCLSKAERKKVAEYLFTPYLKSVYCRAFNCTNALGEPVV